MSTNRDSATNRTLTAAELDAQVASLRTVGGLYDYVAACVEHDNRQPTTHRDAALAAGRRDTMTAMNEDAPIVWVDCETTGLDAQRDLLLEIAVVITDADLNELDHFEAVLQQDRNKVARMLDPDVLRMHTRSGLLADLAVTTPDTRVDVVEERLIEFVHSFGAAGAPAGGSNISFDRGFLEVWMPTFNEHTLHYRSIDVSTVKELARRFAPEVLQSAPVKEKDHRALADVRESIAELRHYVGAGLMRAKPRPPLVQFQNGGAISGGGFVPGGGVAGAAASAVRVASGMGMLA